MVSPRNLRPFIDGTIPAPQQAQRLLMPARQDSTAVFLAKEGDSARVYYPVDSTNEVVAPAQPGIYPQPGSGGIVPVLLGSDGRISQVLPPVSVDLGAAVPVGEAGEKLYGAATATYVDDQLAPARDAIAELTDPETGVVARVDQAQADADAAAGVAASLRALIDAGLMRAAKKSSPPAVEKGLVWAVLDDETGEKLVGLRVPNSDASEWVPYQLLVEDLMVVGEGGTIRFKDGVITAPNLNVTEEMVARFGYFAQAFFDEAVARDIKVTNELIAERLLGKHFIGSLVEGGEILMQGEDPGKDTTGTYTSFSAQADVNLMQNGILGDQSGISWVTGGKSGGCVQSVNKIKGGAATAEISTYILSPLTEWKLETVPYDGVTTVSFYVNVPVADTIEATITFVNANGATASTQTAVNVPANTWTKITVTGPSGYRPGRPPNIGAVFPMLRVVGKPQAGKATATIKLDEITWVNTPNTASSIRLYKDSQGTPSLEVIDFQGIPRVSINAPSNQAPQVRVSSDLASLRLTLDEDGIPVLKMDGPTGAEQLRLGMFTTASSSKYGMMVRDPEGADRIRIEGVSGPSASVSVAGPDGGFYTVMQSGRLVINASTASGQSEAQRGYGYTNAPTSSSGPLLRLSGGRIVADSSTARIKTDIQPVETDYSILDVPVMSWVDKAQQEQSWKYRHQQALLSRGCVIPENDLVTDPGPLDRVVGLIAETVAKTGPDGLLSRNENGEPAGVHSEKIGVYLIPIVRELREENQQLKIQLASLAERLEKLEEAQNA